MNIILYHKCQILVLDNYNNHIPLKKEICRHLDEYPDCQDKSTNVKATMTEWNITSPQIEILKNYTIDNSSKLLWSGVVPNIDTFWASIYRKNEYTVLHDHLPYLLSFVYFLKSKSYYSSLYFQTNFGKKRIRPKEGRLVIFPSYLKHGVLPHKYNDTRITLAGNISI